jgi:uncharacterized protein YyaL (SSP411 family)/cell wall-associated NlpC family hydrolase
MVANRLSGSLSHYLRQHESNPVDWWPWCDEAFAEARARDVPVLLSVGYSACHWCHVMAHESFEDPQTAALMNENLVSIKVDREERPDVDAVYMTATQAMTGQGGWPMTVFMTPDREPFYCGTYFPRETFRQLVSSVARAWRENRDGVTGRARRIAAALAENARAIARAGDALSAGPDAAALSRICEAAEAGLAAEFDAEHGGFGGAPKFPPSMVAEFLLRHHERTSAAAWNGKPGGDAAGGPEQGARALRMVVRTAEAMARGGIYDQLGGGFARYSTDPGWVVPHFEKMLYDNALLARLYSHLWRLTGSGLARRVAAQTCAWMVREMRTAEGGLASALDADSGGVEGAFYVWTPAELRDVLGAGDGAFAASVFGVTEAGTFQNGASVLQLRAEGDDPERFARIRAALLAAREQRARPGRDDKVVAAWNGLAIAALAEAGVLLEAPGLVEAARDAAALLASAHLSAGHLVRTSVEGTAGPSPGILEDYACVAEGFLVLSAATGESRWTGLAGELLEAALARFRAGRHGFHDTADDSERLIYRPADPADGPTPSGTFALAGALTSYAALTGSARHREAAVAALAPLAAIAPRHPSMAGSGLAVAEAVLSGPAEIAVVGPPGDERTGALHRTAFLAAPPGAVIALGTGSGEGVSPGPVAPGVPAGRDQPGPAGVPLLAGRSLVNGRPAAYVCRGFACRLPVTDPEALRRELRDAARPPGVPPGRIAHSGLPSALWGKRRVEICCAVFPVAVAESGVRRRSAGGSRPEGADMRALPRRPSLTAGVTVASLALLCAVAAARAPAASAAPAEAPMVPPPAGPSMAPRGIIPVGTVLPWSSRSVSHGVTIGLASARVASLPPLRRLLQADLLVVSPASLPRADAAAISRLPGVVAAQQVDAARLEVGGRFVSVLGVNPARFRAFAARPTARARGLWQNVAGGGIAISYTMARLARIPLGHPLAVDGRRLERLPVAGFGTVGIGGVDAVVSDAVARSLGSPAGNAIVVSAPHARLAGLMRRMKAMLPRSAAIAPLVAQSASTAPATAAAAGAAGAAGVPAGGPGLSHAQLAAFLRAAESRIGMPYVWGAAGPRAFDCSGLVQWAMRQAGVVMPRVAADQARTGPRVPLSRLLPGDLLFYHTDPTAPDYISHVAIYLGDGEMLQAPEPGLDVEVVPADFGSEFAGAVEVYPRVAAAVAADPAG